MKKNIFLVMLIFTLGLMGACESKEFLEETQTTDLYEETVFSDSTYTTAFLTEIYTRVGFSTNPDRFYGGLQTSCDEAELKATPNITTDIQFVTGTVNPVIVSDDAWNISYEFIRKVNVFLKHLPEAPLTEGRKKRYAAEARFLRAWYYSILLRHYGGVPLVGDTIYDDAEEINATRDTYARCVDYIVSECDAAAKDLPTKPMGRQYGRAGAGACRALKARILLYAASPLFNGSDFAPQSHKELLGYPTYDKARWKDAMDAAYAVMALNTYSLYDRDIDEDGNERPGWGYYRIFLASDYANDGAYSGTIFERRKTNSWERRDLFFPPSRGGNGRGGYPYQELVDAYGMSNGKPILDAESGYDANNPYENRDPRFYISVLYDQAELPTGAWAPYEPVDIYLGNYNGELSGQDAVHIGTPTGYYFRKMVHDQNVGLGTPQSRPLLRYAEVLLNYAEARNEYEDSPSAEVYASVEAVRDRAGLNPFELPQGLSKEEMREIIRAERRVELMREGLRFFDVRRWMIAEETENKMMTGMEVIRDGGEVEYNRFKVRQHVFRNAAYFWPIPYSEVAKSPDLLQNPYY